MTSLAILEPVKTLEVFESRYAPLDTTPVYIAWLRHTGNIHGILVMIDSSVSESDPDSDSDPVFRKQCSFCHESFVLKNAGDWPRVEQLCASTMSRVQQIPNLVQLCIKSVLEQPCFKTRFLQWTTACQTLQFDMLPAISGQVSLPIDYAALQNLIIDMTHGRMTCDYCNQSFLSDEIYHCRQCARRAPPYSFNVCHACYATERHKPHQESYPTHGFCQGTVEEIKALYANNRPEVSNTNLVSQPPINV